MWQTISTVTQLSRNMLHCLFTVQQNDFNVGWRNVIQWRTRNQIRNQTLHQNFHSREDFDLKTFVNEKKPYRVSFWNKVLQVVIFWLWYLANCQFSKFFTKFPIGRKSRTRKTTFWFISLPRNVQLSYLSDFLTKHVDDARNSWKTWDFESNFSNVSDSEFDFYSMWKILKKKQLQRLRVEK